MARPTIEEVLDRAEILDLFNRYAHQHDLLAPRFATGEADGSEFDVFEEIFTADAVLDFTRSGGMRGDIPTMKAWMERAYALFPVQQHVMGQTQLVFSADGNGAEGRTWVINPMGFGRPDGTIHVFTTGGYYLDQLVRTADGWRIRERAYDPQWQMGETPAELSLPT